MGLRADLQTLLEAITPHVYFQPPTTTRMEYPCIVYALDFKYTEFADNKPYCFAKRYAVTIIDQDPDTTISDQVSELPMCIFNRYFSANDLNHHVFNLYF